MMVFVGMGGWDCTTIKWMPKSKPMIRKSLYFSSQLNSFHLSTSLSNAPPSRLTCNRSNPSRFMAVAQSSSSSYDSGTWSFKGSALYQLHLVKADIVRPIIPKQFRLVEAFGYTLGGFFLASYDESAVGPFDELVVIAGLVSDPPTYCAWTSRVFTSNEEACNFGRKDIGIPSQLSTFFKEIKFSLLHSAVDVHVTEIDGTEFCNIKRTENLLSSKVNQWIGMGPMIRVSLPSFSGLTEYNPNLLKYSCNFEARVRMVQPAKISGPSSPAIKLLHACGPGENADLLADHARSLSISVMLSKPILAFQFNCMKMEIQPPVMVSHCSETLLEAS